METIIEPNFIKLHDGLLGIFRDTYAYIDVPEYMIDQVILDSQFNHPVKFVQGEFTKPGKRFIICFIQCKRKHSQELIDKVFHSLHQRMTDKFGQEYLDYCTACANVLIKDYENNNKGDDPSEVFSRRITTNL